MARYGIDYYGLGYYGPNTVVTFDAEPVTATSYDFGKIRIEWVDPIGSWAKLKLVRNPYGFPVDAFDGTTLLEVVKGQDPTTYSDEEGLLEGAFYYYGIFVYEVTNYSWVRAGTVVGLSVKNHNNGDKLYEYMPEVYKLVEVYSVDDINYNADLDNFLHLFGFQLDVYQTLIDLLLERYNVQKVAGSLLPPMLNQFGMKFEPELGYQQARILLRDAIQLYKDKGSLQGIKEYVKAFSSWAVPTPSDTTPNPSTNGVVVGHNLMLDYNDSSFEESTGHWLADEATTAIDSLLIKNVNTISLTSNVATLNIGAHHYDVGDQIVTSGFREPLFNIAAPTTLTGSDQSAGTISFALTGSDVSERSGLNPDTELYGQVSPVPNPWLEPTTPTLYPNKIGGIMSLYNETGSTGNINAFCGSDDPVTKGVPVEAGETYTFSIYASKGAYTARNVTTKIKWYDRFGDLISTSSGSAVLADTVLFDSSYRPFVTDSAPAGAYYACPGITVASVPNGEHHYFDCAQFELSAAVTDFDEARQLHITPRASRINELTNPSFALPLTPWSVTGALTAIDEETTKPGYDVYAIEDAELTGNVVTLTTTLLHTIKASQNVTIKDVGTPYDGVFVVTEVTDYTIKYAVVNADIPSATVAGTASESGEALELTATGSTVTVSSTSSPSDLIGIYYPNTSYTFSVWVREQYGTEEVTASIHWYDASKTLISSEVGDITSLSDSWTRVVVYGTAPEDAAYAHVQINWLVQENNVIEVDQALFENSPFLLDYFDGSIGSAPSTDLLWEGGAANAGRSHLYKNRYNVQLRLADSLKEYVNAGTTIALYLGQPNT